VANESCLDTNRTTAEFFSSRGPTLDGRVKPDIAAIDGVSITGAGAFGKTFFGTSAAAPHMGGIAALLLQSAPCLLGRASATISAANARTTIRDLLLAHATPMSASVPDNVFGVGRADAFSSVKSTMPAWKGSATTLTFDANTTFGASITPAQLGFVDPNACGLTALNWTGGCGTPPGATMTCPAGATTVSVAASNNGFGYGDPVDLQIVVADFAVNTTLGAATVAPGGTSTQVVTVMPQGGNYNSEVILGCATANLPPQTSCMFDPPAVVPGAAGARSTLTISTMSTSAASSASRSVARVQAPSAIGPRALGSGIALFPAALVFGTQTLSTTAPPQFVYLTNTGTGVLALTSITFSGDFSGVNNCGTSVAVGASCGLSVSFTPTVTGARSGTLSILDDASGSPHTVALSGAGQTAPSSTGGTPTGSYTVTVTGTAGTLTHYGSVILTVQ
jgi:hypothetical protein